MADEFFYKFNPHAPEVGPIDSKTLKQLAGSGAILPESLLRRGSGDWVTASTVKGLFGEAAAASPPEATPVAPPTAEPVAPASAGPAPIAAPVAPASASPPEAIPVAPPANDGGGLNLPNVAPTKASPDVPAGLDSLVVSPKKGGSKPGKKGAPAPKKGPAPAAAPAIEVPKAEPVAKEAPSVAAPTIATPSVTAPKVVPSKGSAPKSEPAKVDAPAAVAAPKGKANNGDANPFATDPKAGRARPRRKGTGGIGSLFNFDVLIGPAVIKVLFFLMTGLILLGWLVGTAVTFVTSMQAGGGTMALIFAGFVSFVSLAISFIYIVVLRVMAEVVVAFFSIDENMRSVRDMLEEKQGIID